MSRSNRAPRQTLDNGLTDLVASVRTASLITGGSQLSSYGTIGFSNNYSLLTLNRIILTYLYTTNGLFQTAVQLPIQDAISRGIEIESAEASPDDIEAVLEFWADNGIWEKILDGMTWARLYGGGALLINTNQDPETALKLKGIGKGPLELYDLDRWQLDTQNVYFDDYEGLIQTGGSPNPYFYLWGKPIHESRFIRLRAKRAPSYVRRQLRGWGMSEGERMIRDLNLYLKTQDVLYEILDESKIDVYRLKGLAQKLIQKGGTQAMADRVQKANELKNYVNAIMLDSEDEYEQKTMAFAGLAEVMRENRIGVASALRMPVNKLFGMSASGFASGEDDMESYNQMVESEIRAPLNRPVKELLQLTFAYLFDYVPQFKFKWPSMRVLTEDVQQEILDKKSNRILAFYDRGLIDSKEVGEEAKKAGIFTTRTKMEQGFLPAQPTAPNGPESVAPVSTAVKPNSKASKRRPYDPVKR